MDVVRFVTEPSFLLPTDRVRGCSLDKDSGKLLDELLETLPNLSQLE